MSMHFLKKTSKLRQALYYAAISILILTSIYQVYSIRENLTDSVHDAGPVQETVTGISSSLLTPHEMFLTTGGNTGYVKVEATSGYYPELCEQSLAFLEEAALEEDTLQTIEKEELPDTAVMVLRYAYTLENAAVKELLSLEVDEGQGFQEIWIEPAISNQEEARLYLINWQQDVYMQVRSNITWKDAVNQKFCEAFYNVTDAMEAEYWAAWISFPEIFHGGVYYMQQESNLVVYEAALETSFQKDGVYSTRSAEKYAMHFFPYPDTVKAIGDTDSIVWYADEKRTVRLEEDGFLQYVQAPERINSQIMTLEEAYETAAAFLKEDLEYDTTGFFEIYLCDYEIQDGEYTFYWNYKLDNVSLWMDPERQENWNLPYPVKITVADGIVRYYHRYLVNKVMEPDRLYKVPVSYMEAVDACRTLGGEGPIESMELGYAEMDNQLELCWMIQVGGVRYQVPMEGGGV